MTRLAFLGPRATFCEQAARQLPHAQGAELVPCATTTAALTAVRDSTADLACVPFENSVEGGVPAVLDALVGRDDDPGEQPRVPGQRSTATHVFKCAIG